MASPTTSTRSDDGLVEALRRGEAEAGERLKRRYETALQRFAYGYLGERAAVEDAVQEVFVRVLRSRDVPDELRPWLYRVTRNLCLNRLDSADHRARRAAVEVDEQHWVRQTGNLTQLVREEQRQQLAHLVASLPREQQEVLRLRYAEDLSRAEIADVLGLSVSVVKSRLYEGLKRLRASAASLGDV